MIMFIKFLAIIHLIMGIILLATLFILEKQSIFLFRSVAQFLQLSPLIIHISLVIYALSNMALGIGFFLRKHWGWWMGISFYTLGIFQNSLSIYHLMVNQHLPSISESFNLSLTKHISRIIGYFLLLLFLNRSKVKKEYFSFNEDPWKSD